MRIWAQCAACQRATVVIALLLFLTAAGWSRDHDSPPAPALRIPAAPLGYHPPAKLYLQARFSSVSLDFLDQTHLLFTFREPRLLQRTQHSSGLDQAISALVLELPGGEVVAERHWQVEDRARYVWLLGEDKVLLRVGQRLFEANGRLELKPLLNAETPLREVDVSHDGRLLVIETDEERHSEQEHARLAAHAQEVGADPPSEDVQVRMVRLDQSAIKMQARGDHPGYLPADADGFVTNELLQKERWNVRFHRFDAKDPNGEIVAQVDSTCEPGERFLSEEIVLVTSCPLKHPDHYVAAYSLKGQKLWDGRWPGSYLWPTFRMAQSGSAAAISWIAVAHSASEADGLDDSDVQAQVLSVLDSRTGNLRIGLRLDPILSAGGNFALSPDGNRLAVLNRGAIEVYDLPAPVAAQTAEK